VGSIYALAVSYNIPQAELLWFLVGSALVLLAAMLTALLLVLLVKGLGMLWRRLLPGANDSVSPGAEHRDDSGPDSAQDTSRRK